MPRCDMINEIETLRARVKADYAELVGHAKDAESLRSQLAGAVVLDDDLLANLDERTAWHNLDRNGYLRWVLTGKEPAKGQINA